MSSKTCSACTASLVAGLVIGLFAAGDGSSSGSRSALAPPDFTAEWVVSEVFDPENTESPGHPTVVTVVPYRIERDGVAEDVSVASRGGRFWIVSVDGGRVRVFGTSR